MQKKNKKEKNKEIANLEDMSCPKREFLKEFNVNLLLMRLKRTIWQYILCNRFR